MRSVWTVLSVLALANLLAMLGLVGWLGASDRLDTGRLRRLREAFSTTLTEERAEAESAAKEAEAAESLRLVRLQEGTAPATAEDVLRFQRQESEIEAQRRMRVEREIEDLRRTLLTERAQLDADIEAFQAQREAWERARAEILANATDEQFQKTLATYEQLKPDKAKVALEQLLESGDQAKVIAYLDGMSDRTRTKIIDEFIKDDPKLAADLLERLRARGVEPRGTEGSP